MRFTRKRNYLLVLLLILPISATQISHLTCETYTVDGYDIQTRLVPDKTIIMLGEPVYVSFIVDNHSDQDLQMLVGGDYRNGLGRPESFTVTVQKQDNRHVPQPDAGPGMGGLLASEEIPAGGNYAFRLFLPHWATFQEVGSYTVAASRMLCLRKDTSELWNLMEMGTQVQTEASTKIRVVPLDEVKLGNIIDRLGGAMFSVTINECEVEGLDDEMSREYISKYINVPDENVRALDYIQDERVIPYFIKAFETNSGHKKSIALSALSKFNSESAFAVLQKGFETKTEDLDHVVHGEFIVQETESIHLTAACALAKSPHPGAISYLLSKQRHPNEAVRMTVLHVLGRMKPEEAISILQKMTQDESERVSVEAKRYLKQLSLK